MFEITVRLREMKVKSKQVYTEIEPKALGKDAVYAYVTKDVEEEVVTEIYMQKVELLNLSAVINAVLGS